MPRYLCLREGKDYSNSLISEGVDVVSDLGRLWTDCLVDLDGVIKKVRGVANYRDTPVFILSNVASDTPRSKDMLCTLGHPKLTAEYPELGYFNTQTSVVYLERTIGRQWKQGLHRNTCNIEVPFANEISTCVMIDGYAYAGVRYQSELSFYNFLGTLDVFNPSYPSYAIAMNRLTSGRALSVGLSKDIALALHPINGEVHIMYHELSVGAVDDTVLIRDEFFWLEDTIKGVVTL